MLCCHNIPAKYFPAETKLPPGLRRNELNFPPRPPSQHDGTTGTNFNRPLVKTGGNALCEPSAPQRVSVIVPDGVPPGQTIHINFIDENNNNATMAAVVPPNMVAGSQFFVDVPSGSNAHGTNNMVNQSNDVKTNGNNNDTLFLQEECAPLISIRDHQSENSAPMQPQHQKQQLKVVVPPGVMPGTAIYVQIPGENRQMQAIVPPNTKEFLLEYDPLPSPPATSPQLNDAAPNTSSSLPTQKLMLVNVPPGTTPGTVLHVKVPGEERYVGAKVPEGASSFHVSYS